MSDGREWHYADKQGDRHGPYRTRELEEFLFKKTIKDSTLIWTNGMDGWQPVSEIEDVKLLTYDAMQELAVKSTLPDLVMFIAWFAFLTGILSILIGIVVETWVLVYAGFGGVLAAPFYFAFGDIVLSLRRIEYNSKLANK